jgi:Tol biopolymer transport system component
VEWDARTDAPDTMTGSVDYETGAAMRLLTIFLASILLSGCAGTLSGAATASLPAVAPTSTPLAGAPTAATTPVPSPAPVAVLPGEPWIAYGWPRVGGDGKWAIFLTRPDGSDGHEIAADVPGEHRRPAWSPDGSKLAFVVQDSDHPDGSIWTVNADGSGAALLSAAGTECPVGLFHPAWSPDGTKLAVVCYPGGDREAIAVMDLATMSIRRLATYTPPDHLDNPPTWSPDGRTIAFDILHWDPTGQFVDGSVIATIPVVGGEIHRLTSPDTFMSHPDWSPDGTELVMNSYDLGNIQSTPNPSNLYAIKPDGTGLRQLTHSSTDGHMRIGTPRWDPSGSRIVVSILNTTGPDFEFGGDVRLAFVDAAGGEPVLTSQADGKYPDVRPAP